MSVLSVLIIVAGLGFLAYVVYRDIKKSNSGIEDLIRYCQQCDAGCKPPQARPKWLAPLADRIAEFKTDVLCRLKRSREIGISVAVSSAKVSHFMELLRNKINEQQGHTSRVVEAATVLLASTSEITENAKLAFVESTKISEGCENGIKTLDNITAGI
ncbi:MAG: methyl-accepting chemotaxis protein, partial [Thiotrichales bacterium]|nr:methyl-accepting chemotaxis protein [Thiotrichales bacterium]